MSRFRAFLRDDTEVKIVINGSFVEGPWNNEFGIVRGTVWTTNAVNPAGYGLIFVNLYRGGVGMDGQTAKIRVSTGDLCLHRRRMCLKHAGRWIFRRREHTFEARGEMDIQTKRTYV